MGRGGPRGVGPGACWRASVGETNTSTKSTTQPTTIDLQPNTADPRAGKRKKAVEGVDGDDEGFGHGGAAADNANGVHPRQGDVAAEPTRSCNKTSSGMTPLGPMHGGADLESPEVLSAMAALKSGQ
jgi:hypothetical protein